MSLNKTNKCRNKSVGLKTAIKAVRFVLSAALITLGFCIVKNAGDAAVSAGAGFGRDLVGITALLRSLLR